MDTILPVTLLLAGLLVFFEYARRRGRGEDPLGPEPTGAMPRPWLALVVAVIVYLPAMSGVLLGMQSLGIAKSGSSMNLAVANGLLNLVFALALLKSALGGTRRPALHPVHLVFAGLLGGLATFALSGATGYFVEQSMKLYGMAPPVQDVVTEARAAHGIDLAASIALALVVAPFAEEVFFRGIVFPAFASVTGWRTALVLQAIVFGAVHVNSWDMLPVAIPLAVVGGCAAWLYRRTGSLAVPILVHATFNAVNYAMLRTS